MLIKINRNAFTIKKESLSETEKYLLEKYLFPTWNNKSLNVVDGEHWIICRATEGDLYNTLFNLSKDMDIEIM